MKIPFQKYQGTGNDFIMIDQREKIYLNREDTEIVAKMCDRHFGIGADGLILLQNIEGYDFEMIYFNADGNESSMCGNGGRCIAHFAHSLGVYEKEATFIAIDGEHEAKIFDDNRVELKMGDVEKIEVDTDFFLLDTGSPHYVTFVKNVDEVKVFEEGRAVRYNDRFREKGVNVNFVEDTQKGIKIATYERGVEDETLSCGTGITAAAISYALRKPRKSSYQIPVKAKGGNLEMKFDFDGKVFRNIWLCGAATFVFEGKY